MAEPNSPIEQLYAVFRRRFGSRIAEFRLPPPSFNTMQGEILGFDEEAGTLSARFPILESELNPYHALQGGFLAAAVDNTFGPLSLLVAPPNVTRRLEVTYSRPITLATKQIVVQARLSKQSGRQFELSAEVLDLHGNRLARAQATHWILEGPPS